MKTGRILCCLVAMMLCCTMFAADSVQQQKPHVALVCFSYDRPLQLRAFLESVQKRVKHLHHVAVLYRSSNEGFTTAYDQVKKIFPTVVFTHQEGKDTECFKSQLLSMLFQQTKAEYVLFAVDDIVVTDDVDVFDCVEALEKCGAYGFFLRLGINITRSYAFMVERDVQLPQLVEVLPGIFQWPLKDALWDWGSPDSVDMVLYRIDDFKDRLFNASYRNPSTLEQALGNIDHREQRGLCYKHSKLINIPLNVVQNTCNNRQMELFSTEELLEDFNVGFKIDVDCLYKFENKSPHVHVIPSFIKAELQQIEDLVYFCTAVDDAHFNVVMNFIGSVHKLHFSALGEIAVFDIGLSWDKKLLLQKIQKVHVYDIEPTHPDLLKHVLCGYHNYLGCWRGTVNRGWNAWRPVVIKQALDLFPYVLYVDPGYVLRKDIRDGFKYLKEHGSLLLCSQEQKDEVVLATQDVCTLLMQRHLGLHPTDLQTYHLIDASVQGVSKKIYDSYALPVYEKTKNLGVFADDGSSPKGFGYAQSESVLWSFYAYRANLPVLAAHDGDVPIHISKNDESTAHLFYDVPKKYSLGAEIFIKDIHFVDDRNNRKSLKELLFDIKPNEEKWIMVVIPSYNNKDWFKRNLESVFAQKYKNYHVIYIDDCSSDGTGDLVEQYIKDRHREWCVSVIRNEQRYGCPLANLYKAIHACQDDAIIVTLDGDDWLKNEYVLSTVNKAYVAPYVWLTYGQYEIYPSNEIGSCNDVPYAVIQNNALRDYDFIQSHLRSFYAWLFKKINIKDLLLEGRFFAMSGDTAMMFPMLEMAGDHSKCIHDVLYTYNRVNAFNEDKVNAQLQWACECAVRAMPRYNRLP